MNPYAARTHKEMLDVLRDQEAPGPAIHYYMIRGGSDKKNITIWEPGMIGDEYVKSYGHYHVQDFDERYEILAGEGMLLLQTRELDARGMPIDASIASFRAIRVKAGDIADIPRRAGHLMVNTGTTWLVTRDDSPVNLDAAESASRPQHADYAPYKKMRGAAYYVVNKAGKPALEKNPAYKKVPPASIE